MGSPFCKKFCKLCRPAAISSPDYCPKDLHLHFSDHTHTFLIFTFSLSTWWGPDPWGMTVVDFTALTNITLLHASWCRASFLKSTMILTAYSQWVAFCDSCVFFHCGWTQGIHFHLVFMHLGFPPEVPYPPLISIKYRIPYSKTLFRIGRDRFWFFLLLPKVLAGYLSLNCCNYHTL